MMVIVVAKQKVKPENTNAFLSIAQKLVEETRRSDAGCIAYDLLQDIKAPTILTFLEKWESQEVLNQHMASKHFTELFPKLNDLLEEPGEINIYQHVDFHAAS